MTIFYSKSTRGFYDDGIYAANQIPADAVVVSDESYQTLLAAQANGNIIQADASGNPQLVEATPPPANPVHEAQAALRESDITIMRCYEHGVVVPAEWATYRAALRAIVSGTSTQALPAAPGYPVGT